MRKIFILTLLLITINSAYTQDVRIALLKYNGGGDWYANPTSLPNLVKFCNKILNTDISRDIPAINIGSRELFNFPLTHLTGHGNIILSHEEAENLRKYLISGGFLHISDNYGLDEYIRKEMKKVFPGFEFIELPYNHPIYHQKYDFNNGLPKIHEHDDKDPQGFGLIYEGRLVVFYDYECDLGDGWEDPDVHNDTEEKRMEALKMGANIVQFVFEQ
ncbi:MAG: DUF4159 domain-containing protein [Bacteroidetes bacterium]|nr:DUF4159 domain-containing protein [Bacteroidota bacterium]